jgi:hypothetical protein
MLNSWSTVLWILLGAVVVYPLLIEKRIVGAVPYELLKTDLDELLASVPHP